MSCEFDFLTEARLSEHITREGTWRVWQ